MVIFVFFFNKSYYNVYIYILFKKYNTDKSLNTWLILYVFIRTL